MRTNDGIAICQETKGTSKMKKIAVLCLCSATAMLAAVTCHGFAMHMDLSAPLSENGIGRHRFGMTAAEVLGKPFSPSLVPGPHGEEFVMKEIKDPRFGFDSVHFGFTMESQRLCSIGLSRDFDYATGDSDMLAMVSNVYLWVKSSFGDAAKLNPAFDLHSPPNALYASVENGLFKLRVEASHRQGPCWVMISLHDKHLEDEASVEYGRISSDAAVRSDVERRKQVGAWLAPLSYALLFYLIFCLPVILALMVVYVIVMKVRKQKPLRIIHWTDPIALLVAPYAWGFFEHVGQPKSLSNICEFAIIGWIWCLCMAVRYARSAMGKRAYERLYGYVTFAVVILSAMMLAILFPTLPE